MMERIFSMIGIILAILALVFQLAGLMAVAVVPLLAAAVVLLGVGVLTGR